MPRAVCLSGPPSIALSVLAILASVIFMILARMMDELKDFEKDKIANPTRPLPRGLISPSEMNKGIFVVFVLLMIFTGGVFAYGGVLPASLLLASCLYLWLMYKEFYIGKGWLIIHWSTLCLIRLSVFLSICLVFHSLLLLSHRHRLHGFTLAPTSRHP